MPILGVFLPQNEGPNFQQKSFSKYTSATQAVIWKLWKQKKSSEFQLSVLKILSLEFFVLFVLAFLYNQTLSNHLTFLRYHYH